MAAQAASPTHKFAIGQRVTFTPTSFFGGGSGRGVYTVLRQMPSETRDLQYRIKDSLDGQERMVRESELKQV